MNDVARELFGAPNRKLSSGHEMRYGTRGSMSIDLREGTWFDFEKKEGGGVLDLIERETGLTGKDAFDWMRDNGIVVERSRKRKIAATYNYTNEHGILEYQAVRYDPKDFSQRRPDGNGGWIDNLHGVTPYPFRLLELIEDVSAGHMILIPEGEKDVNALRDIGVPATTNAGGTGSWKPELNRWLQGADMVIVPDNDNAGRGHADKVAAQLRAVAKRVRILELWRHWPDMPEKADVSDWLKKGGGTREQLDKLIEQAPEYDAPADISLDDFRAYMPAHTYIYVPTREMWTAASIDARLQNPESSRAKASKWLDCNRPVEQMTWAPGMPMLIADRIIADGGWVEHRGVTVFNLYRPPTIVHGDAAKAGPWVDHVRNIYPNDADHIIRYLAHRVQRPQEKICHGLVLGGAPGVGKDTLIEPVKRAVGPWNVAEVSPQQMLGRFNGFVKSVILRVSEARDLGEMNRFALYEHMKVYLASPPDVIRCDEKNLREHSVFNVMGVIITSNRKDSFYLPADDRRHYVAWTDAAQEDFEDGYWRTIWNWYDSGGDRHVAAYLAQLDLSDFNPKAPPPKTDAFWEIVETNRTPENSELADAIDTLGKPNAVTLSMIKANATGSFSEWLSDRRNSRQIPHRMSECGYVSIRNAAAKDGQWVVSGKRQAVYVRAELSIRDRYEAAWSLAAAQQELRGPDR
jgi:hypothetical protein